MVDGGWEEGPGVCCLVNGKAFVDEMFVGLSVKVVRFWISRLDFEVCGTWTWGMWERFIWRKSRRV